MQSISARLFSAGIEGPGGDAGLLVRHAFGWSAEQQRGGLPDPAPADQLDLLESFVSRRAGREPLQYITGSTEFYRRRFAVDPRVLIPRPETEQLVVQAIEFVRERGIDAPLIADICTGSGAIAVSLALELPWKLLKRLRFIPLLPWMQPLFGPAPSGYIAVLFNMYYHEVD